MFSLFLLSALHFPCYVKLSLDSKLEHTFSTKDILCQKERQYSVKLHDILFVFCVGWTYILRVSLFIKVALQ